MRIDRARAYAKAVWVVFQSVMGGANIGVELMCNQRLVNGTRRRGNKLWQCGKSILSDKPS